MLCENGGRINLRRQSRFCLRQTPYPPPIFMDQFGAASQQKCYHPLFPFRSTETSKKRKEILPSSRSVHFVSATPYTQDSVAPQFHD
ncbi:hypothetical protein CMV_010276 [Castanea mollissima]|uniref:Uncharacterized protein n=1 Tax=Castanea mollissima TaxID=60419 RepID=A0A8J4VPS4_9ROSI|nr:hypothetical protein CMV_010276 [Castanea mollissima]